MASSTWERGSWSPWVSTDKTTPSRAFTSLDVAYHLVVEPIPRRQRQRCHAPVDEGDGTMFHLPRGVAFSVDITYLLKFKGALPGDGGVDTPTQEQEVVVGVIFARQPLVGGGVGQYLPNEPGAVGQVVHQLPGPVGAQEAPCLAQVRRQQV